jgi:serine protease AprX
MSAVPSSQTVTAGGTTTYTVQVTGLNGFHGAVSLSVSGLPSGAMGSFSPINPSGSSTLSVTTTSSTPTSSSTLNETGVSGNLSHSTTVTLIVAASAPDFNLAATPSTQTVTAGGSVSYTLTATAQAGFNGTSCSMLACYPPASPLPLIPLR